MRQQFDEAMGEHARCGCSPVQPERRRLLDELIAKRDERERKLIEAAAREAERRKEPREAAKPQPSKPPANAPVPPDRVACSRRPRLQFEAAATGAAT